MCPFGAWNLGDGEGRFYAARQGLAWSGAIGGSCFKTVP
jgi:hypothetical protein